ncbi:class I SAM-dependent methyltransferase [Bacillus tuaregi]|uniref:class I SAM-dependent methyltransferase n=1 Tax=Bacillus tuaregi TaxID=1816695 RepID=UPI0008F8F1E1|nr:SAM-dependent methyltransferase [Bacillus tuaregi]
MNNFLINYINEAPLKMISYAEYMNLVLYHPSLGYYMKEQEKIGRNGDFITSSNIADIMGKTFAKWFASLVKNQDISPHFCELGAGNGRFAEAFLQEWYARENPQLTYTIIEKSPFHIKLQKEKFKKEWHVQYCEAVNDLKDFSGMFFSNELFDALPVHVVMKQQDCLYEIMVGVENGNLIEVPCPLSNPIIIAFIEEHMITIPEGHRIEIPLLMEEMFSRLDQVLQKGMIVTIDYGYTNEEWQEPIRKEGSLRGYYQHRLIRNVLEHPGDMDITSHIHWDALENIGYKYGINTIERKRQDEFLLAIGILDQLESHQDLNPFSEVNKRNRAIRSLIMPSGMSTSFQVLVQRKKE